MTRDVLIGTLTGISAVLAMAWFTPRPQAPPHVRELAGWGPAEMMHEDLGRGMMPATRPDEARAKLGRRLERVDVEGMRLDKFLAYVGEVTGVNLFVNWRALEAAGVNVDTPLTMDLRDVPASVALEHALRSAGDPVRLAYQIDEGIVEVSTEDELGKHSVTRIYDVRDLIEGEVVRHRNLAAAGQAAYGEVEASDALCRLLQEFIDPTTWRDAGGAAGAIRPFGGRLIVTQTPANHEQLVEVLAALRRTGRVTP
jgi:hypothetical protein